VIAFVWYKMMYNSRARVVATRLQKVSAAFVLALITVPNQNLVAQYAPPLGHVHLAVFNR
jgi:hypothetical protein